MNTGKRIPATLTAILAILALTACGETPKGDGQGTVNNPDPGYVRWYELPDGSAAVRCSPTPAERHATGDTSNSGTSNERPHSNPGPPQPRHRTHPTSPKGHPPTRTGQRSDHLRDLRRTAHRQHVIHLPRLPGTRKGLVSMHTTWANDQTIGTVHIRRDHRDKLSPYLLEYQSTDLKEDQA